MVSAATLDHCLPDAAQALLLRAALLDSNEASDAWSRWRARHAPRSWNAIDTASARMLPQVYANLRRAGRTVTAAPALVGDLEWLQRFHRGAWHRNQQLIAAVRPVIASLQAAGIQPVLMKGAALASTVYADLGARPMADIDLLVPHRQALAAGRVLDEHGLRPIVSFDNRRVATVNRLNFERGHRAGATVAAVDLHWHLLDEVDGDVLDQPVHRHARDVSLQGLRVRVLHPTDELLLACMHGVRWNPMPPFRWVADVHLLVTRSGADIDWDRLLGTTLQHGFVLPVRVALEHVTRTLATPVPGAVMAALASARPTMRERLEMSVRLSPRLWHGLGGMPYHLLHWWRLSDGASWPQKVVGFPRYLADCWGCPSLAHVPREAAVRVRRRVEAWRHAVGGRG